jgi:hypothetical protein
VAINRQANSQMNQTHSSASVTSLLVSASVRKRTTKQRARPTSKNVPVERLISHRANLSWRLITISRRLVGSLFAPARCSCTLRRLILESLSDRSWSD